MQKNISKTTSTTTKNTKAISKKELKEVYNEDYIQDVIGIKKIVGGLIFLDNGKIISLLEIVPINFYQKSNLEKNNIVEIYHGLFKICPKLLHYKTIAQKTDVTTLINHIKECNKHEKNPKVKAIIKDYITNIKNLTLQDTIKQRFFLSFEYEGDTEGKRSNDVDTIFRDMESMRVFITNVFSNMGHVVINPVLDERNFQTCEILYRIFNPYSAQSETVQQRFIRLTGDERDFNSATGKEYHYREVDLISPRGLNTKKGNYVIADGMFYTYLCIRDNGYPPKAQAGWLNILDCGYTENIDVDVIAKKLNTDTILPTLEQYNRWNRVSARNNVNKVDKANEIWDKVANIEYITNSLKNFDEDLWDVMTIITIKSRNLKELNYIKNVINKELTSKGLYLDHCRLEAFEYYKMTMPFVYINNAIWLKNKRNMLSEGLAHLYNFTSYEFFDDTGFVVGRNTVNNTLAAFNNFNTNYYSNANICILGSSGSGKTFTEEMLGYRMRLTDIRCFFILPIKGYEYRNGCEQIGGEYIQLYPGADTCINIMQIRPEAKSSNSEDRQSESNSLLVKKVVSITTFLQLLMGNEQMDINEKNILNNAIMRVYKRFGITVDNKSIWADRKNKIVKTMPVLKDLAIELKRVPELQRLYNILVVFVEGSCSNMNGQTNVNLDNPYIVFDVDEDVISEDLLPAFLYIAFDCAYSISKQNFLKKKVIFMDEVWKMLTNEDCAKQVKKAVKLVRGYAASVVLATQDIGDFLNCYGGYGKAVLNSTEIKVLLKMKEEEVREVSETLDFNPEDMKKLKNLKRGTGLIYSNGDKVYVEFVASDKEVETFTTDVNVKNYYKERHKEQVKHRKKNVSSKKVLTTSKPKHKTR